MARRSYYVHYYDSELPLAYHLYYINHASESSLLPDGARRISVKYARLLATQERIRRRRMRPDAGISDAACLPASYPNARERIASDPGYILSDWIWVPLSE